MLPTDAAASEPFQKYPKELPMGLEGSAPSRSLPPCPLEPVGAQLRAPGVVATRCSHFPFRQGPTSATDSSVTAAMPGMWTPPPKWRPAARAGSISSSVVSAPAHKGRERPPGLRGEGPGNPKCCPSPSPSDAQLAPGGGPRAATNLSPILSLPSPVMCWGHESSGIPDTHWDGHSPDQLCGREMLRPQWGV